ncbi:MAG: hypothetical protein PHW00_06040 [Clostridia bacterium]|nr:hypothetical protein [Clostridia bacterium]
MNNLSSDKIKTIGINYIIDNLSTVSPLGKERLRNISYYGRSNIELLNRELDNIQALVDNHAIVSNKLLNITTVIANAKNISKSVSKLPHHTLDEIELFEIKKFLLLCDTLSPMIADLIATAHLQGVDFVDTTDALNTIDFDKQRISTFYFPNNYTEQLRKIRDSKHRLEKQLVDITMREQVKKEHLDIAVQERLEEANCRKILCSQLANFIDSMLTNLDCIGYIDLLIAKSYLAYKGNAVRPSVNTERLVAVNLINPNVAHHLESKGRVFTPISIELDKGVTVITGANMGGKSVALQTIMLNCMLANLAFFVYADSMDCPVFNFFEYVSNEGDDAEQGLSAFGMEIIKLNQVVDRAQNQYGLVIFDEFAKTTNAGEGQQLFSAVVKTFNQLDCITVMTTHFDQVSSYANAHYQVKGLSALPPYTLPVSADFISAHLDYGLIKVDGNQPVPKDALTICHLLNLSPYILSHLN